jgi:hypothetical protein
MPRWLCSYNARFRSRVTSRIWYSLYQPLQVVDVLSRGAGVEHGLDPEYGQDPEQL